MEGREARGAPELGFLHVARAKALAHEGFGECLDKIGRDFGRECRPSGRAKRCWLEASACPLFRGIVLPLFWPIASRKDSPKSRLGHRLWSHHDGSGDGNFLMLTKSYKEKQRLGKTSLGVQVPQPFDLSTLSPFPDANKKRRALSGQPSLS